MRKPALLLAGAALLVGLSPISSASARDRGDVGAAIVGGIVGAGVGAAIVSGATAPPPAYYAPQPVYGAPPPGYYGQPGNGPGYGPPPGYYNNAPPPPSGYYGNPY